MKNLKSFLLGAAVVCFAGFAGLSIAANLFPGVQSVLGVLVDVSTDTPVIAQSGQTISGQAGGANTGVWVATGATTGAGTLTFTDAAPNGRVCDFNDETTVADKVTQTTATNGKTVVTIAGTIVSGDQISYSCMAY